MNFYWSCSLYPQPCVLPIHSVQSLVERGNKSSLTLSWALLTAKRPKSRSCQRVVQSLHLSVPSLEPDGRRGVLRTTYAPSRVGEEFTSTLFSTRTVSLNRERPFCARFFKACNRGSWAGGRPGHHDCWLRTSNPLTQTQTHLLTLDIYLTISKIILFGFVSLFQTLLCLPFLRVKKKRGKNDPKRKKKRTRTPSLIFCWYSIRGLRYPYLFSLFLVKRTNTRIEDSFLFLSFDFNVFFCNASRAFFFTVYAYEDARVSFSSSFLSLFLFLLFCQSASFEPGERRIVPPRPHEITPTSSSSKSIIWALFEILKQNMTVLICGSNLDFVFVCIGLIHFCHRFLFLFFPFPSPLLRRCQTPGDGGWATPLLTAIRGGRGCRRSCTALTRGVDASCPFLLLCFPADQIVWESTDCVCSREIRDLFPQLERLVSSQIISFY